ncbi:MAG TPA: GyrI-like domain-containing protein, partial [Candidatus Limnocylindrales bacterium]
MTRPQAGIDVGALVGQTLGALGGRLSALGIAVAGPPYVRYHEWGGETAVVEIGVPVAGDAGAALPTLDDAGDGAPGASSLPGGRAIVFEHRGPYDELFESWARAGGWLEAHGLRSAGAPWESYVDNPDLVPP